MAKVLEHGHAGPHGEEVDLLFAVVGEYDTPDKLMAAVEKAREAGFHHMDAYSPFPIHGLTEAMGWHDTKVPWSIFGAGCAGALVGLGLQYYTAVIDYPMNVGGRPNFSWPSFIPVTYESAILLAALVAVFGMLAFNGLPKPYHPVFNFESFGRASQDRFFLALMNVKGFDPASAEAVLKSTGAENVAAVHADEEGNWD